MLGIQDYSERLFGFTPDGASLNRGSESVKPWLIFIRFIAHSLQLALKDILADQDGFVLIDILLELRLPLQQSTQKITPVRGTSQCVKRFYDFDDDSYKPKKASGNTLDKTLSCCLPYKNERDL